MNREEAKVVLQACRPRGEDAALPVFAEALALAERDAELKFWWRQQQEFDRRVSAKLAEVPVPAELRETILAARKIAPFAPRYRLPYWLAAAAAFLLLLVPVSRVLHPGRTSFASDDYRRAMVRYVAAGPELGMQSPDRAQLVEWLEHRHAPMGNLPAPMATLPTVGCQTLALHGHAITLMCFTLAGGKLVHLFVVARDALRDPAGPAPQYDEMGSWSTASWSDGNRTYLLATQAGSGTLKQLLL